MMDLQKEARADTEEEDPSKFKNRKLKKEGKGMNRFRKCDRKEVTGNTRNLWNENGR